MNSVEVKGNKSGNMDNNLDFGIIDGELIRYNGVSENVLVPNGVIAIGENAFRERSFLKTVSLPNSLQKIGNHAFFGCDILESVDISDGVLEKFKTVCVGPAGIRNFSIKHLNIIHIFYYINP